MITSSGQELYIGRNSISELQAILLKEQVKKALIFTGKHSFKSYKNILEENLQGISYATYDNFTSNPKLEELETAIKNIDKDLDIIIAFGGGSVIDFAKCFKYKQSLKQKLIAIPTTSGTGAESTQFAVLYVNGEKTSLDDKSILPSYAIVDSQFTANSPKYLKACTAIDAYCQAIERYWAVKSTDVSKALAKEAMLLCRDNIEDFVNTESIAVASNMAKASNLAGQAINISRTTAAHALSYAYTSLYGIPHGHAVALNMIEVFEQNQKVTEDNLNDTRGLTYVKGILKEIESLLCIHNCDCFTDYFTKLCSNIGLDLDKSHIQNYNKIAVRSKVNLQRLTNNPVICT